MIILRGKGFSADCQKRWFEKLLIGAAVFGLGAGVGQGFNDIPVLKDNSALYSRAIDHDFAEQRAEGVAEGLELAKCPRIRDAKAGEAQ